MKKIVAILLAVTMSCTVFMGCGGEKLKEKEDISVYSFSGENEQIKISNGVIAILPEEQTVYGGDLEMKQKELADIVSCSMTYYTLSEEGKKVLWTDKVKDVEGKKEDISGSLGQVTGENMIKEVNENIFFELEMTSSNGEKKKYQLELPITEVIHSLKN